MVYNTTEFATKLLSKSGDEKPQEFKRQQAQYKDLTADFKYKSVDFSKQFCYIYAARLAELREILISRVTAKWSKLCVCLCVCVNTHVLILIFTHFGEQLYEYIMTKIKIILNVYKIFTSKYFIDITLKKMNKKKQIK